jgi:hypothetical protein
LDAEAKACRRVDALSTRKLGLALTISHMMVARVWAKHRLKPQRLDRYMASNDPDLERKAADVIGLYVNPPAHAAVFCVDEKTAIQGARPQGPSPPAVAPPGRAARLWVLPTRHVVSVRSVQHQNSADSADILRISGPLRGQDRSFGRLGQSNRVRCGQDAVEACN